MERLRYALYLLVQTGDLRIPEGKTIDVYQILKEGVETGILLNGILNDCEEIITMEYK